MINITSRLKPIVDILNRFAGWLLLLAIGWLCWVAARLLWLLLAAPTSPALPILPIQSSATSVDNSSLFAIFADAEPAKVAAPPPPNVTLKGVLLAIPEILSSALLDVNGNVKNYRIGDDLQDSGYTLISVDWNAVVIADAADRQTVISMADAMPLDQTGMNANKVTNQRLPDNTDNSDELPVMPIEDAAAANDNTDTMDMSDEAANTDDSNSAIDEAVTALKQNPASYLSRMGVMAVGEGYQVTEAMPAGVRNRLGLEPGDRVLTVNGQNIGENPAQDANILQQAQKSGEAQIGVQRGEQVITIRQKF